MSRTLEAFEELDRAHLFETSEIERAADPSRRSALMKLGWAAGIPLVTSSGSPSIFTGSSNATCQIPGARLDALLDARQFARP